MIRRFRFITLLPLLWGPCGQGWAQAHTGSSPFAPPEANDTTFVVDQDVGLDTGCAFRSQGPLTFTVKVTRFVGEVDGSGHLADLATLVANNIIADKATLAMPGFDVDYDAPTTPPDSPERDQVLFNGQPIDFLRGINGEWIMNSFVIPVELIKFPARGAGGDAPTPADNVITINIDTANADELWCTAIDWAALSIKALSPLVLIHGNNSNGQFYDRQGFTDYLRSRGVPFDNSISMPTDTVARHAAELDARLAPIAKSFGVDSLHLVAHSKGGLDSRDYLARYQPARDDDFTILSLNTLSTPHNGSVLADLKLAYDSAARVTSRIDFSGFPRFTETVAAATTADVGVTNLTTTFAASFNAGNIGGLPAATAFNTVAADADLNGNARIDLSPDEYVQLRAESPQLTAIHNGFFGGTKSEIAVNAVYQVLRRSAGVTLTYKPFTVLGKTLWTTATLTSVANAAPLGNDTLVTIPSGQGLGSLAPRVGKTHVFTGADGRNHSDVANGGVAATVLPWIVEVERKSGDLR